jgi:phosphoribosylanthranilate isomerase
MNTKVKICGLKTLKDIHIVNRFAVDYVGFVFASSKRQVSKQELKEMMGALRGDIRAVGVFVNTPTEEINKIMEYCGLQIAQLHGTESPENCNRINYPVWKGLSIQSSEDVDKIEDYKNISGVLLDGAKAGSGEKFNWDLIEGVSKETFTILAGGLRTENVVEGISKVHPQVVDVSSGVEVNEKKDEEKIREFIREVKGYEY